MAQSGTTRTGTLINWWQKFWEIVPFLFKVNIFLPCDPLIPPLHFYPKEENIYVQQRWKNNYNYFVYESKSRDNLDNHQCCLECLQTFKHTTAWIKIKNK